MMKETCPNPVAAVPEHLRRLKSNERVIRGDFIEDGREGFERWEGPGGFRADSFVKTIYRKLARPPAVAGKTL